LFWVTEENHKTSIRITSNLVSIVSGNYQNTSVRRYHYVICSVHLYILLLRKQVSWQHILGAFANCEKRLLVSPVRLSVRMEQFGSHWTDFDEIWFLGFFRKYFLNIKVSLKSDKNNGYFTRRRFHIYDNISLNSSYNEKLLDTRYRETQNTHFMFNNVFPKIAPFMR
jgi:hypothetical protein